MRRDGNYNCGTVLHSVYSVCSMGLNARRDDISGCAERAHCRVDVRENCSSDRAKKESGEIKGWIDGVRHPVTTTRSVQYKEWMGRGLMLWDADARSMKDVDVCCGAYFKTKRSIWRG